jgi:hypothetical protein
MSRGKSWCVRCARSKVRTLGDEGGGMQEKDFVKEQEGSFLPAFVVCA